MIFADVLKIVNGKNQKAVENPEGKYPIYGSGGIIGFADQYNCEADSVIIGRKGSINNPIFVDVPFWNVDTAFGLCPNREILLPRYLYYFCKHYNFERLNKTVTIPSLTKKDLLEIPIDLPELKIQEGVIKRLGKIEKIVQLKREELRQLDELVKARFVEMFGEVTHTEKMKDLCFIITDGTHQPPKFEHTGIPFIFVSNIAGNELTYNAEKFINQETYDELIKRTPIEIGDIVLSTVGSYGHPAVVKSDKKFLFQRHIAYLKPNHELIDSEYLHSAILSDKVQRQIDVGVKGIAQKTLNLSSIKDLDIAVPSIQEQEKFAAFKGQVEKSKAAVHRSLEETQTLFDSLMQTYFG